MMLSAVRDPFLQLVTRWLPLSPPVRRLAFGLVALLPTAGHVEAYTALDAYLPDVKVDPHSSDFLYRINRPRRSKAHESHVTINRLSSWLAYKMMLVASTLTVPSAEVVNERYALRVELDINTVPTYSGVFSPEACVPILNELDSLGIEILDRGDVP